MNEYNPTEGYPERENEFDQQAMQIMFDMGYANAHSDSMWLKVPPGYETRNSTAFSFWDNVQQTH